MKKLALVLMLAIGITACDNKEIPAVDAKPTIKIGVVYPISGDMARNGQAMKEALKIFQENQKSKFHYDFIIEDNQMNLMTTAKIAKKFIEVDKVDVIISFLSSFGAVIAPIADQNETLHFSFATDTKVADGKYNFIALTSLEDMNELFIKELNKRKTSKVDIVVEQSSGPLSVIKTFEDKAKKHNIEIINKYSINPSERDFRMMITKIQKDNPQLIVAMTFPPVTQIFLRQLAEKGSNIPVSGMGTFTYLDDKSIVNNSWYIDAAQPSNDYLNKFKNKTNSENTYFSEYFYTILEVIDRNLAKFDKKPSKERLIKEILTTTTNTDSAIGKLSVNAEGVIDAKAVVKIIKNGKPVLIEEK